MHALIKDKLEQAENWQAFFIFRVPDEKEIHFISRSWITCVEVNGNLDDDKSEYSEIKITLGDENETNFNILDLPTQERFLKWLSLA